MGNYFGTDGIRGVAASDFPPDRVLLFGQAIGRFLHENYPTEEIWVGIGKDTRLSGDLIESSLIAGLLSMGVNVKSLGILPTPAIARLTMMEKCQAGIVISASHNPLEYNGIKIFSAQGTKFSDQQEQRIEYWIEQAKLGLPVSQHPGIHRIFQDAPSAYAQSIIRQYPKLKLNGLKVAIDCAYGATFWTSPHVLEHLGAKVLPVAAVPDGSLINVNCGSTYPEYVEEAARLKKFAYDVAFTHDGDGDRVLTRYQGTLVDGDHLITMIGLHRQHEHQLNPSMIVGTVMTNSGIELFLNERQIKLHRSKVGDRYVLEDMIKYKALIGGEQSGHLIFLDKTSTGDGLVSILESLDAMIASDFQLMRDVQQIPLHSQVLLNVKVSDKEAVLQSSLFLNEIEQIKKNHPEVRLVIRPSGTEPLFRILTEALDSSLAKHLAEHLANLAASI